MRRQPAAARAVTCGATINRVGQVHAEQMDYVEVYTRQISRWRNDKPSAVQANELDRMDNQNQQLRSLAADILARAGELREGTIQRVLGIGDLELCLQYVLGKQSSNRG
jgi:hypothetical protein